jgi:hypothetical protein
MDKHATVEVLMETVFSMQRGYKEDNWGNPVSSVWDTVIFFVSDLIFLTCRDMLQGITPYLFSSYLIPLELNCIFLFFLSLRRLQLLHMSKTLMF